MRPALALVHRSRRGHAAQLLENGLALLVLSAGLGEGDGVSGRAGHGGGGGEVVEGEAAGDGRPQGGGFEEQPVPLVLEGVAGVAGGVGGVTEDVEWSVLVGDQVEAHLGLVVFGPGAGGEGNGGV